MWTVQLSPLSCVFELSFDVYVQGVYVGMHMYVGVCMCMRVEAASQPRVIIQ